MVKQLKQRALLAHTFGEGQRNPDGGRPNCSAAPESKKVKRQLRQLLYGAKRDVYRIIFEIDERRKVVRVLTIRHGAMDEFISGR